MENNNNFENNQNTELELDPELTSYPEELRDDREDAVADLPENIKENSASKEDFVPDPLPPIMPRIEMSKYTPIDTSGSSKGIKVFAIITAFMIIAAAFTTTGYYIGKSGVTENSVNSSSISSPDIDLAKRPTPDNAKNTAQIYEEINKSIVGIYVYNSENLMGSATGVIYSKDGYIVTNDHIYTGVMNPKFKVYTYDGRSYDAKYIGGDQRSDLAIIKVDNPKDFNVPTFGDSSQIKMGESVVAVGRYNGADQPTNVSEGVISATSVRASITTNYSGNYIQTDSVINPGSSGGALCNIYGQVIGITNAKIVSESYDGVGFAIPTVTVKTVADSLIKYGTVKGRARLGITYQEVSALAAEVTGNTQGLEIAEIDKESDLYGRSVKAGDIITHINGKKITSSAMILDVIESSKPGSTVTLRIYPKKNSNNKNTQKSFDITVRLLEDKSSSSYNIKVDDDNEKDFNIEDFYGFNDENGLDY